MGEYLAHVFGVQCASIASGGVPAAQTAEFAPKANDRHREIAESIRARIDAAKQFYDQAILHGLDELEHSVGYPLIASDIQTALGVSRATALGVSRATAYRYLQRRRRAGGIANA
jgi:hypothetical protein